MAPSDFHLFGPMKEHLRGQKFADDDEVMEAVQSWLKATPKSFFLEGIRKLEDGWTKKTCQTNSCPPRLSYTFQSHTFSLALPVSWGYQTQSEYYTRPPSQLNHKLS